MLTPDSLAGLFNLGDSSAKIKQIFNKVKPEGHAEEVLAYLKTAAKGAA